MLFGLGFAVAALAAALGAVIASALGQRSWTLAVQGLRSRLEAARTDDEPRGPEPPARYAERELAGLPAPVQRYFRAVLQDGQPIVTAATIDCTGRFNLSTTGARWKPFTSHQRVTTRRPGFVWDARIALAPGLCVRVVDSCIRGQGLLRAALQGLFTVAAQRGDGEIARGELMRWFAESPWYPTALLPSQGVRWAAVDDHSAQATVVDGPLSLTLLFRFDGAGLIGSFRAEARGALVGGQMVMTPWEGVWSNYRPSMGMQVPYTGEVAWVRPAGRRSYFVGTVTAIACQLAP